jgi:hypothetical protein
MALALLLAAAPAAADGIDGKQYFSIGGGGGILTSKMPCPDLPCNGTDTCSCVTSSGTLSFNTTSKQYPKTGTYVLEVSADVTNGMPNGVSGMCYGSGGYMIITTERGTLTIQYSGPACRLGRGGGGGGGGPDAVAYGICPPAYIVSGTGGYANPTGTGALLATFNPWNNAVLIDLVGYGILH